MKFATLRHLLRNDARLVARDKMLVTMALFVVVIGVATRYALPALDASFAASGVMPRPGSSMRFSDTFPAFVVFLAVWQGANIPGIVCGFLMLDEKEDETLRAMRVTPLPFASYTGYRVALAGGAAFLCTVYLSLVIGLCGLPLGQLVVIAACAALTAPLAVLLYATYAANKIQGLAFTKFAGIAGLLILIGFFVPEPWQWALGLFPPFLTAKAYWMALAGESLWWGPLVVSAAAQLALLRVLIPRFRASVV